MRASAMTKSGFDPKTFQEIKDFYLELRAMPDNSRARKKQRRGYKFQDLISALLNHEDLEPRVSYRSTRLGEEIDGSFFLDGTVFLVEAKWHARPLPASTLYQFKGKIDGKLVGTLGVFISMSGYSSAAADALTFGKSINLLLFDRQEMDSIFAGDIGFRALLKQKLRDAAEAGIIYTPREEEVVEAKSQIESARFDSGTNRIMEVKPAHKSNPDLVVVCEGDTDRMILIGLADRILTENKVHRQVRIVTAMGKRSVARVTRTFQYHYPANTRTLLIVDGDGDQEGAQELLQDNVSIQNWTYAIPDPGIEAWFGDFDLKALRQRRQTNGMGELDEFEKAIRELDLIRLKSTDRSFETFYNEILGKTK